MLGCVHMQTELKQLPKSEISITVALSPEEIEKYELEATRRVSEKVEIPGFRKGQAPKAFVLAQIGAEAFGAEVLNVALPHTYFQAVKDKNLQIISRPEINVVSKSPLKYEARVAVMPEITLKGMEKIKIKKEDIKVSDKEVDEVVEEMRKYKATYKPLERGIRKGDRVEIDFQGYDEGGAAIEKTKSKNHPLFVGEGNLVQGFEDHLLGMKVNEKKKFPIKFPSDFHSEPLREKTVNFEMEIKRAEEPILPELNEDLVAQLMGERKPVSEMKESLKRDIHSRKEVESRRKRENDLLERFLKEAKLDVPPVLVNEEVDYMIGDLQREIEARGLKFETYMEKMKKEKRDLRKEYESEAEKRIRIRLILNYLFRTLNIDVSEEEMQDAAKKLLERTPEKDQPALQKSIDQKGEVYMRLKNNLMLEKLFAKFLE